MTIHQDSIAPSAHVVARSLAALTAGDLGGRPFFQGFDLLPACLCFQIALQASIPAGELDFVSVSLPQQLGEH